MDVPPGHCWRCGKPLPQHSVPCDFCPVARYCTILCRKNDKARHVSVECQLFKEKTCGSCGRTDKNVKECCGCNNAWYCNKECQTKGWKDHKQSCRRVTDAIQPLSITLNMRSSALACTGRVRDSPHYFGNTMAEDFLKLEDNEWSDKPQDRPEEELTKDYHVLSVGCGDLRNTVLTAGSLPARFQGKLHITLNDFDPFVMARNVLFLFMLVRFADIDGIASCLTTIWYSLHISKTEYDLIKTSLDELTQMTVQQLNDATKGLVSILEENMNYLHQVWKGWQSLECQQEKRTAINLRKQRKKLFETQTVKEGVNIYLNRLLPKDKEKMTEWFDHALFLPTETVKGTKLPYDNPTLTGREACWIPSDLTTKAPEDYAFIYCIDVVSSPFKVWDCLRVRESTPTPCPSPMVMYHNYVTNLLQKVKSLILQGRLLIHISLANCLDFPTYHQALQMPNYDRIFTSNLADYVGLPKILQTFKPLLNASNPFSAIVTETMNWFKLTPKADIEGMEGTPEFMQCNFAYLSDTNKIGSSYNSIREYFDNTLPFLLYLRADIMAGGHGIPALKDAPSLDSVKKYHGMQMRDFRKGLNKLVPFQYRVNARDLTMLNRCDRAVEWCLPKCDV